MPSVMTPSSNATWWSPSERVTKQLPPAYTIRPLAVEDYDRGYLQCLSQLTLVGDVSRDAFQERLSYMQTRSDTYMPIVMCDGTGRVVACGTLLIERKFIHDCGALAHIEDIVHLAFAHGCYKITLDCDIKNEPFYEKSDFETKGLQMCIYYRDDPATTPTSPKYCKERRMAE